MRFRKITIAPCIIAEHQKHFPSASLLFYRPVGSKLFRGYVTNKTDEALLEILHPYITRIKGNLFFIHRKVVDNESVLLAVCEGSQYDVVFTEPDESYWN